VFYSCDDDLSVDDIYHPLDWTADGIVNMHEYGGFAQAWLSADPNSPLCDPNDPIYTTDPNSPRFISEGDLLRYNRRWDIDDDLDVDMADFVLFYDEWLWTACWKESRIYRFDMMAMAMAMGGGESMMMTEPFAMESSTVDPAAAASAIEQNESPTLEQSAAAILGYVNWCIEQNHPNTEALYDMRAFLEETLKELRKKK